MKKHVIFLLFSIYFFSGIAQKKDSSISKFRQIPNNSLYIEIGGHGLLYSINYERVLFQKKANNITGRIGTSYFAWVNGEIVTVPLMLNGLFRFSNCSMFEFGVGYNLFYNIQRRRYNENFVELVQCYNILAGYRFQGKRGFLYRVGFTPLINNDTDNYPVIWFGMSFGYSFPLKNKN